MTWLNIKETSGIHGQLIIITKEKIQSYLILNPYETMSMF